MTKDTTKRANFARLADFLDSIVKLGRPPAPDGREVEVWLDHVRAGELFNQVVAKARLASYFESAVRDVLSTPTGSIAMCTGEGEYSLDYIVPGEEPEAKTDRLAYWWLFQTMKTRDKTIEELRRALRQLESSSWRPGVIADQNSEKEPNHVEQQREPTIVASQ